MVRQQPIVSEPPPKTDIPCSLETTYQKLFSAQRSPTPQPTPSLPHASPVLTSTPLRRPSLQASLHNFWSLPRRPSNPPLSSASDKPVQLDGQQASCEDCDAVLGPSLDDTSMAMELDLGGTSVEDGEYTCRGCGRRVCEMCAVVTFGEGRECLQCKTNPKKWVGGIGWLQPPYL